MNILSGLPGAATPGGQNHRADDGSDRKYTPSAPSVETILSRLRGVRYIRGRHWLARCPACQEYRPTLLITEIDDRVPLIFCFAGCSDDQVRDALSQDDATHEALQEVSHG